MNVNLPVSMLLGTLAMTTPAAAHHAFSAQFDIDKPITIAGTVTKIEWRNPHTWFYVDVDDGAGHVCTPRSRGCRSQMRSGQMRIGRNA